MSHQTLYEEKRTTADWIAAQVRSGWVCCTDIAAAIPPSLLNALGERAAHGALSQVTLHTMLDLEPLAALSADAADGLTPVSWFSGRALRAAVHQGRADLMPCYYRDMPRLIEDHIQIDALFCAVSPMDKHGFLSTGATASNFAVLLPKAKRIYVEVNSNMPRSLAGGQLHISDVTALCESTAPLPAPPPSVIDSTSAAIGGLVAEEIPNGATLQLGIGAVPEAVGQALRDKRDLGIHTELLGDSIVELVQCGAAPNLNKPLYRGKTVATLAFGSRRVYDFIDDNPSVLMLPVSETNDPAVIAQHPKFMSVNAAVEVDLFGQVCAESAGALHISGTGGQADFVRGAAQSIGGKSFIAFPSTARGGTASRIRSTLTPGAVVTTSKNDVDYIVTEYGTARLRGKTLSQRAKLLISVAHPKFREELTFQAKRAHII